MYADTDNMLTRRQSPATAPLAEGTGVSGDSAGAGGAGDDEQEVSTVTPSAPAAEVNNNRRRENLRSPMPVD
jgi:hypothetical protein